MDAAFFDEHVVKNRLFETERVLGAKADEYARGDRLSNFKKAADLLGCTPERALLGFAMKHIVALADFVADLEAGKNQPMSRWTEKTGDIINYMILLEALLVDRQTESEAGK
jgi:hypothetical protein